MTEFVKALAMTFIMFVLWNLLGQPSWVLVLGVAGFLWVVAIGVVWWDTPRPGGSFHVDKDGRLVMGDTRSPRQAYRARQQEKVT